jgi:hypothetical protein
MDMKKILQAFDKPSSVSVENSAGMKKFMSIVTEGANPHKVSLPVQMAMDHYSIPTAIIETKPSLFKQYVAEAEEAVVQKQSEQKQLMKQYARIIAERVQMKENFNPNLSPNTGFKPGPGGPGLQPNEAIDNPKDKVTMDIPLLIRLLEYAREDAKTDMDLHNVTEKLIDLSETGDVLTMNHYDAIVGEQKLLPEPTNESCWKDYKQVGMKKKGNKTVPNCVPKGKK